MKFSGISFSWCFSLIPTWKNTQKNKGGHDVRWEQQGYGTDFALLVSYLNKLTWDTSKLEFSSFASSEETFLYSAWAQVDHLENDASADAEVQLCSFMLEFSRGTRAAQHQLTWNYLFSCKDSICFLRCSQDHLPHGKWVLLVT